MLINSLGLYFKYFQAINPLYNSVNFILNCLWQSVNKIRRNIQINRELLPM